MYHTTADSKPNDKEHTMKANITIHRQSNLPMPLIYLATPEDWADWYISQLERNIDRGEKDLSISVFSSGLCQQELCRTAQAVLRAAEALMQQTPSAHLKILCGDEDAFCAYRSLREAKYCSDHRRHSD